MDPFYDLKKHLNDAFQEAMANYRTVPVADKLREVFALLSAIEEAEANYLAAQVTEGE